MEKKKFIDAGEIVNTHGIRGEVKILPWLDSAEFLAGFKTLYLGEKPIEVISAKVHKGCVIAELSGITDVNAAMALRGKTLCIDRADAHLPKGAYFIDDIIGAEVKTPQGELIGTLCDVFDTPANRVFVVRGETEHMIPAVPEFIKSVDADSGIITAELIEGM